MTKEQRLKTQLSVFNLCSFVILMSTKMANHPLHEQESPLP
jgi:hypothetical protein